MASPSVRSEAAINGHSGAGEATPSGFLTLMLGSLGVVFGDIGTSPLYAFREAVAAATGMRQIRIATRCSAFSR